MTTEQTSDFTLDRRQFLTLCAVGTLPGLLAACQSGSSPVNATTPVATKVPSPTLTNTPTPSPTRQLSPTESDWSTLANNVQGAVIRPGNPQYATARQLFNPSFDTIQPAAVIYCASPKDVQTSIAFAQRFNFPVAPRSGGHSYAGYSTTTGLILDLTRMNKITVDSNSKVATIDGGAHLIDVYSTLTQAGLILPAGSCPTVGVAGLTLGGGLGVLGRKFGLTCDSLLSAQVVLADGRLVTCSANQEPDLFFALRGGGGGNFGVVTSFSFQTYQLASVTIFTLRWPWSSAADVVDAWQNWAPQAPDELWSNCLLDAPENKSASPIIQVNGVYVGTVAPLNTLLQQLTSRIATAPTGRYVAEVSVLDAMLYEAGCYGKTVGECHLPSQDPNGQVQRERAYAKSDYYTSLLPRQAINNLVNAIASRFASSTLGEGGIGLDAYGGATNRVPADATAFVHRNALFSAEYSGTLNIGDSNAIVTANHAWVTDTWQSMRSYASGAAYQNYIDPDLSNWQQAYYGTNLPKLQRIKATYDPNNFFHFNQSIPLPS